MLFLKVCYNNTWRILSSEFALKILSTLKEVDLFYAQEFAETMDLVAEGRNL